jgi:hypothetical protein
MDLGSLLLGARILEREQSRLTGWAFSLFFALFPLFGAYSVLGLETSLFVFLLFSSAMMARRPRLLGGIPLGLMALTRPEGIASAFVVGLGASWRARAMGLAVLAGGFAALTLYYGSPVPQSVLAKATTYGTPGPLAGVLWVDGLVPFLLGRWQQVLEMEHLFPLAIVSAPAVVMAAIRLWRQDGASRYVAGGGVVVLAGYFLFGVSYFAWYLVLPLVGWMWMAAIGLPIVVHHRAIWIALALYVVSDSIYLSGLYRGRARSEYATFHHVAAELKSQSGGQGLVFLEPIGYIGYLTRLRVVDEVGLVSPEVRERREEGDGWYTDVVREKKPDFLVVRQSSMERNQPFAGRGKPFRSLDEGREVLSWYEWIRTERIPEESDLQLLRRRRETD